MSLSSMPNLLLNLSQFIHVSFIRIYCILLLATEGELVVYFRNMRFHLLI